jgi:hypothetical protein
MLVGKPEGKRPLGRPRRRWVDNIKMLGCSRVAAKLAASQEGLSSMNE